MRIINIGIEVKGDNTFQRRSQSEKDFENGEFKTTSELLAKY